MEHNITTPFGIAKLNESTGYYRVQSAKDGLHNRFLHQLIWEDHYKRPIPEGCVIHHINSVKTDNRIQNLICVPKKVHDGFHARHRSKETIEKIRDNNAKYWKGKKGKEHSAWKDYARIVKNGHSEGKQRYAIRRNGKLIKRSIYYQSLVKWFKENYPNEYLEPWGDS